MKLKKLLFIQFVSLLSYQAYAINLKNQPISKILANALRNTYIDIFDHLEKLVGPASYHTTYFLLNARVEPLLKQLSKEPKIKGVVDSLCNYWIAASEDYSIITYYVKENLVESVLSLKNLPELKKLIIKTSKDLNAARNEFKDARTDIKKLSCLKEIARCIRLLKSISDRSNITYAYISKLTEH
jgi:hypothetical protein